MKIRNRKLVKFGNHDYGYFIDGILIKRGVLCLVRMWMEKDNIRDIDFALKIMDNNGDDIADFGIMGNFIISQKFENADLGFKEITV